jgi:hypothetical protein
MNVYFGPKGLEFKSQPSQKIIFKKLTVGRESYQQEREIHNYKIFERNS